MDMLEVNNSTYKASGLVLSVCHDPVFQICYLLRYISILKQSYKLIIHK